LKKIHYNPKLKDLARRLRNNSTKAEIKLWSYLKRKQLMGYDFDRQKPVNNYIVDFFSNKLMLAIELDGYTHSFEEIHEKDKLKEERLRAFGITVLRFTDDDIMNNIENVLGIIGNFIKRFEMINCLHTPLSPLFRGDKSDNSKS
jgi:very-short-patch-repair endonuclease